MAACRQSRCSRRCARWRERRCRCACLRLAAATCCVFWASRPCFQAPAAQRRRRPVLRCRWGGNRSWEPLPALPPCRPSCPARADLPSASPLLLLRPVASAARELGHGGWRAARAPLAPRVRGRRQGRGGGEQGAGRGRRLLLPAARCAVSERSCRCSDPKTVLRTGSMRRDAVALIRLPPCNPSHHPGRCSLPAVRCSDGGLLKWHRERACCEAQYQPV